MNHRGWIEVSIIIGGVFVLIFGGTLLVMANSPVGP